MPAPAPEPHNAGRPSHLIIALAAVAAALFLYLRNFLPLGIPFAAIGDQNQFFARAVRILHGQVPYRDFFAFVTPGTEYLFAAGFRIFGVHAWVISAWSVATGLAFCIVLTRIAAHILRGCSVLLPALLFLVFDFNGSPDLTHHWFSSLCTVAAAAVLMRGLTVPRIVAAGALCAVAALFTQTEGIAAFAAIAVYFVWAAFSELREPRSRPNLLVAFAALLLPFAGILAVILGLLARAAGLRKLFYDLVLFAPRYLSSMASGSTGEYLRQFPPLHTPSDLLHVIPVLFIYAMVPYIYAIGIYRMVRSRASLSPELQRNLILLHLIGVALFFSVAHSARLFRLTTVAAPAIVICVWLLSGTARTPTFLRHGLAAIAAVFALVLPAHRQAQHHVVLDLSIGRTAFVDPLSAREFHWIAARTHPGESFFNNSALALYLEQRNPTALEFINPREFTRPEWVQDALAALNRDPPHFIVLQPPDPTLTATGDHTAPIYQFVQQDYDRVAIFPLKESMAYQEEIWERKTLQLLTQQAMTQP